jgi:uncharacterized membrane protein YdbT with pleckstrin-like domain
MAKFVSKNFMADENIVYITKLHWIIYVKALVAVLIGVVMIIVIPIFGETGVKNTLVLPGIIVIVIGVLYGIYLNVLIKTSEFVVTNKRVIMKKGIISTTTLEVLFSKAESISTYQSIGGKLFGYGNIAVIGSGGTKNVFYLIEKPFEFRKAAQDEIDRTQRSMKQGPGQSPGTA